MQHQLIIDILEALHTIELYEDLVGCDLDSDWEDPDYNPLQHRETYFESMSTPMSPCEPHLDRYWSQPGSPFVVNDNVRVFIPMSEADESFEPVNDFNCEHNVDTDNYMVIDGPCCAPIQFNFGNTQSNMDGPSTEPLRKCFYRQPNDAFHDNDPYMYYEGNDQPTDDEYFAALFTLSCTNDTIMNDEDYSRLQCPPLHYYIEEKKVNIDTRLTRKQYREIRAFYTDLERMYANLVNEYNRIEDIQWQHDEFY